MATAGRDQDNGRVAGLLFGECRTSLRFWRLEKGVEYDDFDNVRERQEMEPSLCDLRPLGSSCLMAVAGRPST